MGFLDNMIGTLASPDKSFGTLDTKNPAPAKKALSEKDVLSERALKRFKKLVSDSKKKKTAASAASSVVYEASRDGIELRAKWTQRRNDYERLNQPFPDTEKAMEAEESAEHRADLAEASAASNTASAEATEAHNREERAREVVTKAVAAGRPIPDTKVNLRSVTNATIEAGRTELLGRRAEVEETETDLGEIEASIDAQVATSAKRATLTKGRKGWIVRFPRELVSMGATATDSAGLFAAYFGDILAADLKAQARAIIGDTPTMTTAARREALAKIDSALLELDRQEAELAWAAHEAGAPLVFRKGMRASIILGIGD